MSRIEDFSETERHAYFHAVANPTAGLSLPEKTDAMQYISETVRRCHLCPELASTRCQTVAGEGSLEPDLCFIGEAPGADEDKQGRPFVGRAGQLLDRILQACKFKREEIHLLNILKCRPPANRAPTPLEASNCLLYLRRQLHVLKPRCICVLGATAAQTLLQTATKISHLRGRWHEYEGIPLLCTYHPAYLLRNPNKKIEVWQDMQMLMAKLAGIQ